MNKFRRIIVLVLFAFGLLVLVGCNSFVGIKKDFDDAGYLYSEDAKQYVDELLEEFEEADIVVRPHVFTKELNIAIVLEFSSSKEMEENIDKSETLKGFLKDLKKSEYVRGNCVLIPIGINIQEMIDIFQGDYKPKD